MCGICGYVDKELIPAKCLQDMNDTMYHRGPNDHGIWELQREDYAVAFAQRRLSILDLSELGHQPMLSGDGEMVIIYNGEIYNFLEIRKELEGEYVFHSHCDTEVILAAYQKWGLKCFEHFNGMFAIALYDKHKDRVILARDRIGKKPLYYYHKDHTLIFGSELKPIMKHPSFCKEINRSVIGQYMCNKYIASPDTIFCNTYKVKPGTYVIYEKGIITEYPYWNLLQILNDREISVRKLSEGKRQLRDLLRDSIQKRLIADVPVGTFLSGGIDSTLVTAIAQEVTEGKVDSFTIGFEDEERNEAPYAAQIAKHIGTNHHELYMSEQQIFEMISELPKYYDEPFSDSSQLPCMLVSQMAVKDITVALSGDGGDELFCGYKMYDWTWVVEHFDWLGAMEHHMPWNGKLLPKCPSTVQAIVNNRSGDYKCQLYIDVMIDEARKMLVQDLGTVKFDVEKEINAQNLQERRMILDMLTYLPDDILAKMDRASMKYSLEVRCPLLDYEIIEWSLGVSHELKYHHFDKKYLLKELTYDYVPKRLLDRPKKGFGIPLRRWLRTILKEEILRYADKKILKRQEIFDAEYIHVLIGKQMISDNIVYGALLWSFYVFQVWYQYYIEDLWNE